MWNLLQLIFYFLITLHKLCQPGGAKAIAAENIALRQQLITLQRTRKRAPNLTTVERFIFGLLAFLIPIKRFRKIAVVLEPVVFYL